MNSHDVVIAGGAASLHQAQLWRQWTDRVTFFVNDAVELDDTARAELAARGIAVVAQGGQTGAMINIDLVYEDVREAVASHPFTPGLEREVTERVLGERRPGPVS
jgi:hypothetical protein